MAVTRLIRNASRTPSASVFSLNKFNQLLPAHRLRALQMVNLHSRFQENELQEIVILHLIRQFEGLRLTAYRCPSGIWTIGYGHTENVHKGDTITQSQANEYLRQDKEPIETYLNNQQLNISQNQFDALTSLIFNIGISAFSRSTLLKLIRQNPNDPAITAQFLRWIHSDGKVLPGLQRRRTEESKLYFLKM